MSASAYSYLRFTSPKQADGDSLTRQAANREHWLSAHPKVNLDTSLVLEDRGRSAFRRTNWDTYALARFVDCIKSGRVEPGSYLLVENLDRLSREDAGEAVQLFLTIVNAGVIVVQLAPVTMEFKRPVEAFSLMYAIMELSRGHSESAIKSERVRAAWLRKNEAAPTRVVTRNLPGWIRRDGDRLVLDPGAAEAVRRAFSLAIAGHGILSIARQLNAECVPVIGRKVYKGRQVKWAAPTLHAILTSRATIGEYSPYRWTKRKDKPAGVVVPNYFPPLVDEDTFHAAGAALAMRSKVGRGRRGTQVNLFAGLLRDARYGGSVSYNHCRGRCRLVPSVAKAEGETGLVTFSGEAFDEAVLSRLAEIKASEIRGDHNRAGRDVESLAGQVAEVDNLLKLWTAKMDDPAIVDTVAAKLAELNARRKDLSAKLGAAQREAASPLSESWSEFRSLAELLEKDRSDDLRLRVRAALRRAIESVHTLFARRDILKLAAVRVQFRGTDRHRDYVIVHQPANSKGTKRGQGRFWVESLPFADAPGECDLRDPEKVPVVEQWLASIDWAKHLSWN